MLINNFNLKKRCMHNLIISKIFQTVQNTSRGAKIIMTSIIATNQRKVY